MAMLKQRMLGVLMVAAISSSITLAQEPNRPGEAARIRSVIAELNEARKKSDAKAFSQLFVQDGTLRVGNEIIATGRDAIERTASKPAFWTEVTPPIIGNESVRFVSSDVALVDATQTQYGSLILKQSVPVTLLMKLDGQEWRIVSLWLNSAATRNMIRSHFLVE
jgi:uncharacterized protein (TIGR02246 family)